MLSYVIDGQSHKATTQKEPQASDTRSGSRSNLSLLKKGINMNIVQPTTTSVKPAASVNWTVAAIPEPTRDEWLSPYMLGVLDAQEGTHACPEMYFTQQGQKCEYCEGFEEVAGPTLTTQQILGAN